MKKDCFSETASLLESIGAMFLYPMLTLVGGVLLFLMLYWAYNNWQIVLAAFLFTAVTTYLREY